MTMIDRGEGNTVKINFYLFWGVFVGIVCAVFWGATTIANLQAGLNNLQAGNAELKGLIIAQQVTVRDLETRVRQGETDSARDDARFESFQQSLAELKAGQRDVLAILRNRTE